MADEDPITRERITRIENVIIDVPGRMREFRPGFPATSATRLAALSRAALDGAVLTAAETAELDTLRDDAWSERPERTIHETVITGRGAELHIPDNGRRRDNGNEPW